MEQTNGLGADRGAECVGYQAHDPQGHEDNSLILNELVQSVRFTGGTGTVGVYVPQDSGGPDDLARHGKTRFDFGEFWLKGQAMGTGQRPVKRYNRYLRSLIHEGKVAPSWIVSHDLPRPGTRRLQALRRPRRRLDQSRPAPEPGRVTCRGDPKLRQGLADYRDE
jgi:threonine dehydrogenase-like Zn-dependent dehydrogenase